MKTHPMLFNGAMVRAILDGRKTQTRRPMKRQPDGQPVRDPSDGKWYVDGGQWISPPVAEVGDVLWVRETLRENAVTSAWRYEADGAPIELPAADPRVTAMLSWAHHKEGSVCVSIHMPRWAARIFLRVADVRAQRIQDISEEDAVAEGIERDGKWFLGSDHKIKGTPKVFATAHAAFVDLWHSVYGRASWDANPWVWALTFERTTDPGVSR
jgi:hypothetical protein